MKKAFLFLLLAIVGFITGCGNQHMEENEPITFSILYNDVEDSPFQTDWLILDEYLKAKNVVLDVQLGDDTDFENAIKLGLLSENKPDVILKCWPDTIESYIGTGDLLDISKHEALLPYFKTYIEKNDLVSELDSLKTTSGSYYLLPGYQRELQVQQWIYREDVFSKYGLEAPKTYDELFDALLTIKSNEPNTTPITASWGGAHLFAMMGAGYGIPAGWSGQQFYDPEKDMWLFAPATENYREMYRFLNRCYEANLLDPDIFTQSNDEFIEKLTDGRALVTVTWISSGFDIWNNALKDNGISDGNWEAFPVPESTIGMRKLPAVDVFRKGLAISKEAEQKPYFNDMMAFLDWAIYSEEGIKLTYWGVEGLTYKETSEGKTFLPDVITPKNPEGTVDIKKEYGFNAIFNMNEDEAFEDSKKPDDIVRFLSESERRNETLQKQPRLSMSSENLEIINVVNDKLLPYVEESSIMFITGEMDIAEDWDVYIKKITELGYPVLENIWNSEWTENGN